MSLIILCKITSKFNPSYIYNDVEKAIDQARESGEMHQAIISDIEKYLPKKKGFRILPEQLTK